MKHMEQRFPLNLESDHANMNPRLSMYGWEAESEAQLFMIPAYQTADTLVTATLGTDM